MARVTIEDCVRNVSNRFELVVLASVRAKDIVSGSSPLLDRDNDKETVISLREIASAKVDIDDLRKQVVKQEKNVVVYETVDTLVENQKKSALPEQEENEAESDSVDENKDGKVEAIFASENLEVDD